MRQLLLQRTVGAYPDAFKHFDGFLAIQHQWYTVHAVQVRAQPAEPAAQRHSRRARGWRGAAVCLALPARVAVVNVTNNSQVWLSAAVATLCEPHRTPGRARCNARLSQKHRKSDPICICDRVLCDSPQYPHDKSLTTQSAAGSVSVAKVAVSAAPELLHVPTDKTTVRVEPLRLTVGRGELVDRLIRLIGLDVP